RDVARALAGGDLDRRPALAAPGELGELASALHRLAEALSDRVAAHAAEDALVNATLDALHEGVVAVDARSNIGRINETARRLLGVRDALPFHTDRLPRDRALREALANALAGAPTDFVETALGDRTLTIAARPLAAGGAVLAVLDLTTQRRLETTRRDFVANVSHELKTPITVIGGFADTLLDPDLPPASRQQFAETIRTHAHRMHRIVDDLLDLARIESGGWIPQPAALDLRALAPEATAVAAAAADERGLTLDIEIAPGAATVWADSTALRQVLANLADNAVRHTATGRVTVFAAREAGGVWVGVRDTGVGIPAEHLPRIFERFYRVDPGRSREQGGTGLGLSIVRHLVEAHGGRVAAESVVAQGTTIRCWFPDAVA
ncbi:MAG: HAMP domain-containing protein, partial [Gemmatimonadetes bacterium]|nr:HAMP domain-containing protein [Gemmatimonadota bacterium]